MSIERRRAWILEKIGTAIVMRVVSWLEKGDCLCTNLNDMKRSYAPGLPIGQQPAAQLPWVPRGRLGVGLSRRRIGYVPSLLRTNLDHSGRP